MNDKVNPTGLDTLAADIAQADALMHEIADHMKQAESVIEAQTLAALMTHALIHKTFFQAVQTMRSKP